MWDASPISMQQLRLMSRPIIVLNIRAGLDTSKRIADERGARLPSLDEFRLAIKNPRMQLVNFKEDYYWASDKQGAALVMLREGWLRNYVECIQIDQSKLENTPCYARVALIKLAPSEEKRSIIKYANRMIGKISSSLFPKDIMFDSNARTEFEFS